MTSTAVSMRFDNARLGMLFFLASEIMFFTGLIGAVLILRRTAQDWAGSGVLLSLPWMLTGIFVLTSSSFCAAHAVASAKNGNATGIRNGILLAAVLGLVFLGIQAFEYHELLVVKKILPASSMFASCFFMLTAFHGLHVLAGIFCLFYAWGRALGNQYTSSSYAGLEILSWYWYLVDAVWLVLAALFYFS